MNEFLGYIKYISVALIPTIIWINWFEIAMTGGLALLAGFMTACGGFLARLLTNWMKRKWNIFRSK